MDLHVHGTQVQLLPSAFRTAIQKVKRHKKPKNNIRRWIEQEWNDEIYQEYTTWLNAQNNTKLLAGKKWKNLNNTILTLWTHDNGVKIIEPLNIVEKEKINDKLTAYLTTKH